MNDRLSKVQGWVLDRTYRKTVNGGLPRKWIKTRKTLEEGSGENAWRDKVLFKEEILLNLYHLPRSKQIPHNSEERFRTTKEYRKALVVLCRSLESLRKKRLIEIVRGCEAEWTGIVLTNEGRQVAQEFFKDVNNSRRRKEHTS